ncbi:hypothetical protein HDF16_002479 [Granulicella aggregans]|uniref:Peptidase YpeB-like protein n=1 Tax=Granulicella aggregans TaxID=474949 RepID=A0A7W7ZDD2_9BACT|nr:hypothetical protein [Granulicella aggregans]MBB5057773.1 hypothetical protein [Granulicella aggregans]
MKSILIALLLSGTVAVTHAQRPTKMSAEEASRFAMAAISSKAKQMPGFQLLADKSADKGLYVFNAIWEGLPGGSVEIGFYAVDPITGTVWDAVMECDELSTPKLRALQRTRRKQSGYSKAQLHKLQVTGPQCSAN